MDAWSEKNERLQALLAARPDGATVFPMTVAAGDDMGRLLVEALAGAEILTREAVKEAFERIKCLPATLGEPGTTLGFGHWDRGRARRAASFCCGSGWVAAPFPFPDSEKDSDLHDASHVATHDLGRVLGRHRRLDQFGIAEGVGQAFLVREVGSEHDIVDTDQFGQAAGSDSWNAWTKMLRLKTFTGSSSNISGLRS